MKEKGNVRGLWLEARRWRRSIYLRALASRPVRSPRMRDDAVRSERRREAPRRPLGSLEEMIVWMGDRTGGDLLLEEDGETRSGSFRTAARAAAFPPPPPLAFLSVAAAFLTRASAFLTRAFASLFSFLVGAFPPAVTPFFFFAAAAAVASALFFSFLALTRSALLSFSSLSLSFANLVLIAFVDSPLASSLRVGVNDLADFEEEDGGEVLSDDKEVDLEVERDAFDEEGIEWGRGVKARREYGDSMGLACLGMLLLLMDTGRRPESVSV
jgi:hypothetical protein